MDQSTTMQENIAFKMYLSITKQIDEVNQKKADAIQSAMGFGWSGRRSQDARE